MKTLSDVLKQVLLVKLRYGLITAGEVVELLQTERIEKDTPGYHMYATSPGIYAWCRAMAALESTYGELAVEDRDAAMEEVQCDMETHLGTIQYCLESYEEILEAERENWKSDQILLEQLVQRRLVASLATKV